MRVLRDTEKLDFVSKSVSWIQGHDIMDSCFILNFGFKGSVPWPQVKSHIIYLYISIYLYMLFDYLTINSQVSMRLADEDSGKGLQIVSGSQGMKVPSACTIVIIAGFRLTHTQTIVREGKHFPLQVSTSAKWTG